MPSNNPNSKPSRQSAYRSAQYARQNPAQTFTVSVDLAAFDDELNAIASNLEANVRPAAQAGSEILYQAVLRNVRALGKVTGNLESAIYQAFSDRHSERHENGYTQAMYHVSWNPRKAPHAHNVEWGHLQKYKVYVGKDGKWYTNKGAPLATPRQVGAKAFVRRAMSEFPRAEEAMAARLLQGVA